MAEVNFPEDTWTSTSGETWTRQEFLDKLHCEGGLEAMVSWGGSDCFPPSLRDMAGAVESVLIGNA